jgi:glycerophosphoryl diester phosphodiesterase
MPSLFDLQGHRGARGLKPENTLPAFETAFDLGVTTVETDVHLSRDRVPVLFHDALLSDRICRLLPGSRAPDPASRPLVSGLTMADLRGYCADRNPDPLRFPDQEAGVTPLAQAFARENGLDPFTVLTLADLFALAAAYAGEPGRRAGKTDAQRQRLSRLRFDLELKRVPFWPMVIGDQFDGDAAGLLEEGVVAAARAAGVVERCVVRSFDHRAVRAARRLEPGLTGAVLIAETAPVAPARLAREADAQVYCPDFRFLDAAQVRQAHAEGVRVVSWTVNEPAEWTQLLDWGVDGITTDFPDRLAVLLGQRGVAF